MKLYVKNYEHMIKTMRAAIKNQPNRPIVQIVNELAITSAVPICAALILCRDNIFVDGDIESQIINLTKFYGYIIVNGEE